VILQSVGDPTAIFAQTWLSFGNGRPNSEFRKREFSNSAKIKLRADPSAGVAICYYNFNLLPEAWWS